MCLIAAGVCGPGAAEILEALQRGHSGSLVAVCGMGIEEALRWLAECVRRGSRDVRECSAAVRVGRAIDLAICLERARGGAYRVKRAAQVEVSRRQRLGAMPAGGAPLISHHRACGP